MKAVLEKVLSEYEAGRDSVLVTIVEERGSTPRGSGARMVVGISGQLIGTIGGGKVEKLSEELAVGLFETKQSLIHTFRLYANNVENLGLVCGGDVTVHFQYISSASVLWHDLITAALDAINTGRKAWLIEKLNGDDPALVDEDLKTIAGASIEADPCILGSGGVLTQDLFCAPLPIRERAIIFGGGHCAYALAPVLQSVGFRVTVFDEREAFASRERFPGIEEVICGDFTKVDDYITFSENDYVVIMTPGHQSDYEVERQVIEHDVAYLGCIGSKTKIKYIQNRLRECGISEERIASVHAPIGIKIKSVTPEEIAISITGEIILCRAQIREKNCESTKSSPMH